MPKYYYDEDREETIRPHKVSNSKPRKRSDHKHEYETVHALPEFKIYPPHIKYLYVQQVCKICGRVSSRKLVRVDE